MFEGIKFGGLGYEIKTVWLKVCCYLDLLIVFGFYRINP